MDKVAVKKRYPLGAQILEDDERKVVRLCEFWANSRSGIVIKAIREKYERDFGDADVTDVTHVSNHGIG